MAKPKSVYVCQECGASSPKWIGKCPGCEAWNSLSEELVTRPLAAVPFFDLSSEAALPLTKIVKGDRERLPTGLGEFDRVLGGGIVPGSMVLLGGDPGIGKSTLVLQILDRLSQSGASILYVTGEESQAQIKLRADRLGIQAPIWVLAENSVERIVAQVQELKPDVLVVDSIQTVYLSSLESAPGSVAQVRESAGKLLYLSKSMGLATVIVGHVTKEGAIAGPRLLEHLVDCVLYFEGDTQGMYRLLRATKNRYGSVNEIGVFEMGQQGLCEVPNPSSLFLGNRGDRPGSAIFASLEGARPFLVEIQALVAPSALANPRRTHLGVEGSRVAILIAVLEKFAGLNLFNQDIYVSAAGGFRVNEPAADLAILAAIVSSFHSKPLPAQTLVLGEVGLSGEIRALKGLDLRLNEAVKLGFKKCILPKNKDIIYRASPLVPHSVQSVPEFLDGYF